LGEKKKRSTGWGYSSVAQQELSSTPEAQGSIPQEGKKTKEREVQNILCRMYLCLEKGAIWG
jgi:hypothetical protein